MQQRIRARSTAHENSCSRTSVLWFVVPSAACILLMFSISLSTTAMGTEDDLPLNNRPIIGILAQETYSVQQYLPTDKNYTSFIAASYVKYIESGGARVVPIMIGKDDDYYENIVNSINGIVFPGGATWFNNSNGYGDCGVKLYKLAKEKHVPIWGICLGMELITYAEANKTEHRANCNSHDQVLPLDLKPDFRNSKTFGNVSEDIVNILQSENVTYNYHRYCITEKILKNLNLEDDWHVLSVNKDRDNFMFISSMESRKYPIFALQFHPEKILFEWTEHRSVPHSPNAVRIAQYFVDRFVQETRTNFNRFASVDEERRMLIYNYTPFYSGSKGSVYEQLYLFE